VHLLQIWITPNQTGIEPRYAQREFPIATEIGKLHLVAGPVGEVEDVIPVQQDMRLYAGQLAAGDEIQQTIAPDRYVWIQVVRGEVVVNETPLQAGDGVAISEEDAVAIAATTAAELLLFDLP
jgi:redox-sensitive bicupin YhaK (pirin superfamily)